MYWDEDYWQDMEEEMGRRRTVVGFGTGYSGSRSGAASYSPHYPPSLYGGSEWSNTSWGRKKVDLPAPLFLNNFFRVDFTCGTCGKHYSTFSARPDVTVSCVFCGKDGHIEVEEVFEQFELKDGYTVCPNCKLAVDTEGEKAVFCPKCGGAYAELEKGRKEIPAK